MSVALEHVMLSALPPGAELVVSVKRDGEGLQLRAELVTRGTDRSGMHTGESRHAIVDRAGPTRQVLGELARFVTANQADEMMRSS